MTRTVTGAQKASAHSGFTLLELLVALMIAAIIIGSISASLAVAFKARESAERVIEPGRTFALATEILRADFEAAIPPNTSTATATTGAGAGGAGGNATIVTNNASAGSSGGSGSSSSSSSSDGTTTLNSSMLAGAFTGYDTYVDFYSVADSPDHVDGNGEIKQIEFALEIPPGGNDSDQVLVRRVWRNIAPLAQNLVNPDEEVICRGVRNFALRYFDGTNWLDNWDPTQTNNALPAAVEVTLELNRPAPDGQVRTIRNVTVFAIPSSTLVPGSSTSGTGSLGF